MKTKRQNTPTAPPATREAVVTAENVERLGEIIAARALKTTYQKSGMPYIWDLYKWDLYKLLDGSDIAQTASAFLCEHIGKRLSDTADNGETDKNGEKIDIWRACFRACHRYIRTARIVL